MKNKILHFVKHHIHFILWVEKSAVLLVLRYLENLNITYSKTCVKRPLKYR